MKILYGVQGTGNGHITRARAMQKALADVGAEVDWVFSGRKPEQYFDMQAFGDYRCFKGLTFVTEAGKVNAIKTFAEVSIAQLVKDARSIDVAAYDLVITDFEPVVAWAAKMKQVPCIGLGHQYAFDHAIPKPKKAFASTAVMKWFAPVTLGIGVHWDHFEQPILPPIIEADHDKGDATGKKALVYLPFEKSATVLSCLQAVEHEFIYHCGDIQEGQYGNVHIKGFSRTGFQDSLHACETVICNAGFELASESLSLGRKILVKPLAGQMEQMANALALVELGYGQSTHEITPSTIERFLNSAVRCQVQYPNVPALIAEWLMQYPKGSLDDLVATAWHGVVRPVSIGATNASVVA